MLIIEVWIEGWIANQKLNAFLTNRCNSYILQVINGKVPIPPVWWQFLQFELMFLINYLSKTLIQTVGTATKLGDWNIKITTQNIQRRLKQTAIVMFWNLLKTNRIFKCLLVIYMFDIMLGDIFDWHEAVIFFSLGSNFSSSSIANQEA